MPNTAEDVIVRIFEVAAEDSRSLPVLTELRKLFESGRWSPEAISELASSAATRLVESPREA